MVTYDGDACHYHQNKRIGVLERAYYGRANAGAGVPGLHAANQAPRGFPLLRHPPGKTPLTLERQIPRQRATALIFPFDVTALVCRSYTYVFPPPKKTHVLAPLL